MALRKKTKINKTGRTENEQFVKMSKWLISQPAFVALSTTAKVLYIYIKMIAFGDHNGQVRMTVQEAAAAVGVSANTAAAALHDLQAKGFLVLTTYGMLGVEGKRSSPLYGITEYKIPPETVPRNSFLRWKPDHDFPVLRHKTNNPNGWNGKTHLKT
ncbi:MAG: hypothetical protein P8O10_01530 [Pseudorhodobacter sp.]|nr:hypothetical protein [Pseudorhodobacter sp.]